MVISINPVDGLYVASVGVYCADGIVDTSKPVAGSYVAVLGVKYCLFVFAIHTEVSVGPAPGSSDTNAPPVGRFVPYSYKSTS